LVRYPSNWVDNEASFATFSILPQEHLDTQKELETMDDISALGNIGVASVEIREIYDKNQINLVNQGECERAVKSISGIPQEGDDESEFTLDLGQEVSDISADEISGNTACRYTTNVNFFVEIIGTGYVVTNEERGYVVLATQTGKSTD